MGGFGFIYTPQGSEAIVHQAALPPGVVITPGMQVEFELSSTSKGQRASNVQLLDAGTTAAGAMAGGMRYSPY
eukprot:NODE_11386_length_307_cov_22.837209_g10473_i0.p2 GENE.NODE_11386_length_307_cov_22.837209_g10473_i0~~NODE_11386_length_307_cov_22.837209_g10473_i0.p2  ORF type:complete len:81 (-),score=29.06 NODE_11386_length_307_cov_22.837209_g10473_i0:63-281(-)